MLCTPDLLFGVLISCTTIIQLTSHVELLGKARQNNLVDSQKHKEETIERVAEVEQRLSEEQKRQVARLTVSHNDATHVRFCTLLSQILHILYNACAIPW